MARLNQLHGIVVPNLTMEKLLVRYGVEPRRITRCAYGITLPQAHRAVAVDGSKARLRIGFVGTLASYKGCHVLLDAVREIPRDQFSVKIYGRESDFPDYVAQLRQLSAGNAAVQFCGLFPIGDIGRIMAELDVVVVPSTWNENTPLVVYAAQGAGCVVIGSHVPGIAEAVRDGVDGLLFPPGNVGALRQILQTLIDAPAALRQLRSNCRPPKSISHYVDELLAVWSNGAQGGNRAVSATTPLAIHTEPLHASSEVAS
jgi:glycosyltransferase involved in cell wall biosynthesis